MKFVRLLFFAYVLAGLGIAHAQLALTPNPPATRPAPAAKPANAAKQEKFGAWIVTLHKDEVSDEVKPFALDEAKTRPLQHGNPIRGVLAIRCATVLPNQPPAPQLVMVMYGLGKIGHRQHYSARFRVDEKMVYDFDAALVGTQDSFLFPFYAAGEIRDAKRLRLEILFPHQAPALFDFDITGSTAAITALACN
jgi:hypothetical protein